MEKISGETLVYIIVEVVIAALAVVGNSLVCHVVFGCDSMRKKPMYMFLMSLASADIFVGIFAIPFAILTKLGLPHDNLYLCIVMLTFIIIPTQISIFNLMAVSIERYLAIRYPRFHFTKLTKKLASYFIVLTWITSILVGILPLLWNNIDTHSGTTSKSNREALEFNISYGYNESDDQECQFMEVMSPDFLFFNFVACVLPPLLVCALLYLLIYLSISEFRITAKTSRNSSQTERSYSFAASTSSQHNATLKDDNSLKVCINNKDENAQILMCELASSSDHSAKVNYNEKHHKSKEKKKRFSKSQQVVSNHLFGKLFETKKRKTSRSEDHQQKQQKGSIFYTEEYSSEGGSEKNCVNFLSKQQKAKKREMKKRKEIHAAAVLGIIVLMFALCWLPIHILNGIYRFTSREDVVFPSWLFSVAILLSHANSAVNFFLYSWRLKAFRRELYRQVISKLIRLRQNSS